MNSDTVKSKVSKPSLGYGDYIRFSRLIQDNCGLNFPESRRSSFEQGLLRAFAASPSVDLDAYYRLLQSTDAGDVYFDQLVNALTTNETYFFRDEGQINALYYHVLPQLIKRRQAMRTLRIWSVGCASGEEPYSIAILLRELIPNVDDWAITILGTDINTEVLDRARKGMYSNWAFREVRARELRLRYFHAHGKRYELTPEVRRMVTFSQLNLADDTYPAYETNTTMMDLILCRNVMIYFESDFSIQLVGRLQRALVQDGWLVVGHSEHALVTHPQFQSHNFPNAILHQNVGYADVAPVQQTPPLDDTVIKPVSSSVVKAPGVKQFVLPDVSSGIIPEAPKNLPGAISVEQAQELLEYGHSNRARDMLLALVEKQPDDVRVGCMLGQAYANLGNWQEAEHWCREAIKLDNLRLNAYYTLALVLEHQGQVMEAINAMKKVVYIDRNYVLGHFNLANLYYSNGQLPQAIKSLDNARRLLTSRAPGEVIAGSGGVMVRSLLDTITRQSQQWPAG